MPSIDPIPNVITPEVNVDGDVSGLVDTSSDVNVNVQVRRKAPRLIIIEPVLAMFFTAFIPTSSLISQFVYTVVSSRNNLTSIIAATGQLVNSSDPTAICKSESDNLTFVHDLQNYVQEKAAYWTMILNVGTAIPSVLAVLYFGALSDKIGRKIPMILPILGQLIKCAIFILVLHFRLHLSLLLVATVIEGLFGGLTTLMMSGLAYLTDICEKTQRTVRLTIIEVTCGVCSAAAQILMGLAITYLGYLYPFYIVMGIHAVNLVYVIFFVPEMRYAKKRKMVSPKEIWRTFHLYVHDDGAGTRRKRIICLLALVFCTMTVTGRWDPLTLYLLNTPLCFDPVLIGFCLAFITMCAQAGQMGSLALLYKRIGAVGLAIMGCISGIIYFFLLSSVQSTTMMFLISPVGFGSFLPLPMLRGLQSQMASAADQGALFASTAAVETLCALAGTLIFNPIYSATLDFMTGFVFIVMAIFLMIGLGFILVYVCLTRDVRRDGLGQRQESDDEPILIDPESENGNAGIQAGDTIVNENDEDDQCLVIP